MFRSDLKQLLNGQWVAEADGFYGISDSPVAAMRVLWRAAPESRKEIEAVMAQARDFLLEMDFGSNRRSDQALPENERYGSSYRGGGQVETKGPGGEDRRQARHELVKTDPPLHQKDPGGGYSLPFFGDEVPEAARVPGTGISYGADASVNEAQVHRGGSD